MQTLSDKEDETQIGSCEDSLGIYEFKIRIKREKRKKKNKGKRVRLATLYC